MKGPTYTGRYGELPRGSLWSGRVLVEREISSTPVSSPPSFLVPHTSSSRQSTVIRSVLVCVKITIPDVLTQEGFKWTTLGLGVTLSKPSTPETSTNLVLQPREYYLNHGNMLLCVLSRERRQEGHSCVVLPSVVLWSSAREREV